MALKLLFDENLPPVLARWLAGRFPGSAHVRDCGLKGAADETIWAYAQAEGFVIVSKDADFYAQSLLRGAPPQARLVAPRQLHPRPAPGCSRINAEPSAPLSSRKTNGF